MPRRKRTGEDPIALAARKLVARNARRLREMMGVSLWDVAGQGGMTVRTLQRIEAGESNLALETLVKLSIGLSVDVMELFEAPPKGS